VYSAVSQPLFRGLKVWLLGHLTALGLNIRSS
jgi:hypothetical protein